MAPLSQAIQSKLAYIQPNETHVYSGIFDEDWVIGSVANGGSVVACMIWAATQHQSKTSSHPDPTYVSAQFFLASSGGAFEIHIHKSPSTTSRYTRLDVDFLQPRPAPRQLDKPTLRVRAHMIFGNLPSLAEPSPPSQESLTLLPNTPHPFARLCPLRFPPQECTLPSSQVFPPVEKKGRIVIVERPDMLEPLQGEGLRWGAWLELTDETEDITVNPAMLALFADLFKNGPLLLTPDQDPTTNWFATMALNIEFKARFPLKPTPMSSKKFAPVAPRTVGVSISSKFVHEGRHDDTVEIWSAPGSLGGERTCPAGSEEWRAESQILALATQVGLSVPWSLNTRNTSKVGKL